MTDRGDLRVALVALLPIVTGLNGIVWAEIVARSGAGAATACGAVAYAVVAVAAMVLGEARSPTGLDVVGLVVLTALNMVTSTLWIVPIAGGTRYLSLALIEGAWPIFSMLFAWLLFGRRELDATSAVGGLLILAGSALVLREA